MIRRRYVEVVDSLGWTRWSRAYWTRRGANRKAVDLDYLYQNGARVVTARQRRKDRLAERRRRQDERARGFV